MNDPKLFIFITYMLSVIHCYKCEAFDILRFKHLLSSCLTILESSTRASTSAHMSIENTEPQLLSPASHPASSGPTAAPEKYMVNEIRYGG